MRNSRRLTLTLAAALALGSAAPALATAEPTGCCCIPGATGNENCSQATEKECLAKQQAVPKYDDKTKYDAALKKSEAEEAGQMKAGWREGSCPAK
jgi:hypothetical protein